MGRVAEVRARAQRKTGNLYDTWFTRRVSAWVTAALVPTGITPNAVSWINLLVGAAVCAGIATGRAPWALAGTLGIHLYAVLDSVDGELARWHGRSSLRGMFLENWSAYLMINGFQLAVGAYLWRRGLGPWPLAIAVVIAALGREAAPAMRRTVLEHLAKLPAGAPRPHHSAGPGNPGSSAIVRFAVDSLLYQTNVWVVLSTAIAVEQIGRRGEGRIVLALFCAYAAGNLLKEAAIVTTLGEERLRQEVERARSS